MNKIIQKIETLKAEKLEKEKVRLKDAYDDARLSYGETGYDRYYNKMNKCEKELEEIEEYLSSRTQHVNDVDTEMYKEYIKMKQDLQSIKAKWFYIKTDLCLPATADIVNLTDMLRDY